MNMNDPNMNAGLPEQTTPTPEAESTAPETLQPSSETPQQQKLSESEQVKAIEALIAGDKPDDPEQGEPEPAPGAEKAAPEVDSGTEGAKPLTIAEAAERLEIEPDALYEMTIKTRDGQELSIGALKDAYQKTEATQQEIAKKRDDLSNRENGLASDVMALGVLEAMHQIPEGIRAQANGHLQQMAEREFINFLELFPDYKQDDKRVTFLKGIDDWLGEYGMSSAMIPIKTVGTWRFLKDASEMKAELKRLKTPKAKKAGTPVKPQRAKAAPRQQSVTGARGRSAEVANIAKLLKG